MNRTMKRITLITLDLTVFYLAGIFSYLFLSPLLLLNAQPMIWSLLVSAGVYIGLAFYFRLFDKINRYTSIRETIIHALIITLAFTVSDIFNMLFTPLSMRFPLLMVHSYGHDHPGKSCWLADHHGTPYEEREAEWK